VAVTLTWRRPTWPEVGLNGTASIMNTRVIRLLLPLEAVTFVAAALIHFGVIAAGYKHEKAGVAESVIAAVLLTGGILAWLLKGWTRKIGLAAQAFALLGTLVGVFTIAIGVGPRSIPDVAYHVAIVAVLICGLLVAARAPIAEARHHQ
jgi:hypothetical protein